MGRLVSPSDRDEVNAFYRALCSGDAPRWRKRAGWTQAQVGAEVGYNHVQVCRLEKLDREPPLNERGLRLARLYQRLHQEADARTRAAAAEAT